jgi:DNA-binding PadR family transcriptional regulator
MSLPRLTHLQYLVVSELARDSAPGRAIRDRLREAGVRQSGPAFYQLMAGLEDGGFVSGWYEQQVVEGQIIRQRHYRALAAGVRAVNDSRSFYDARGARSGLARA